MLWCPYSISEDARQVFVGGIGELDLHGSGRRGSLVEESIPIEIIADPTGIVFGHGIT